MIDTIRVKAIKKASFVGVLGNGLLSAAKIIIGIWSGSLAVLGDGIDSATDILTSLITLFAASIMNKPPDKEHPYGHGRAETIATAAVAFIVFFAGAQLAFTTLSQLIWYEPREVPSFMALIVSAVSIGGKIFLAFYKNKVGKKHKSSMLIADAKNMKMDILLSGTVLAGLLFTHIFSLPILDTITAFIVSIWIIRVAFEIFLESNYELMDGHQDMSLYKDVFKAVNEVEGALCPHRVRIRKINNHFLIDIDIEVEPDLTVTEGHAIGRAVERSIRDSVADVYDIMIHIEPKGNIEDEEKFGLSPENIDTTGKE